MKTTIILYFNGVTLQNLSWKFSYLGEPTSKKAKVEKVKVQEVENNSEDDEDDDGDQDSDDDEEGDDDDDNEEMDG